MNANGNKMTFNDWVNSQSDYLAITGAIMKSKKVDLVNMIMRERYENAYTVGHNLELEEKVSEAEGMYDFIKRENKKLKAEHNHFNEIWKTECITEQDIIDMKRQISNQCDIIKKLKEEIEELKQYEQHEETILASLNFYTEQCEELKETIEKKDRQIALLVNNKKKREQQLNHIRKICEEKVEDVLEECFY